jgi:hypothetical protein
MSEYDIREVEERITTQTLNQTIDDVLRAVETLGRYSPVGVGGVTDEGYSDVAMEDDRRGDYLDRQEVLAAIERVR